MRLFVLFVFICVCSISRGQNLYSSNQIDSVLHLIKIGYLTAYDKNYEILDQIQINEIFAPQYDTVWNCWGPWISHGSDIFIDNNYYGADDVLVIKNELDPEFIRAPYYNKDSTFYIYKYEKYGELGDFQGDFVLFTIPVKAELESHKPMSLVFKEEFDNHLDPTKSFIANLFCNPIESWRNKNFSIGKKRYNAKECMKNYSLQLRDDFTFHQSYGGDTICSDNTFAKDFFHIDDVIDSLTYNYVVSATQGYWHVERQYLYLYNTLNKVITKFKIKENTSSNLILIGRDKYQVTLRKKKLSNNSKF